MRLTTMIKDLYRFSLRKRKPINIIIYKTMEVAAIPVAYVAVHSSHSMRCVNEFVDVFRETVLDHVGRFGDEKKS
jgi:hypothetical protein